MSNCSFRILQTWSSEGETYSARSHYVILSTPQSLTSHRADTFASPFPLYQLVGVQPIVTTRFFYICAQCSHRLSVKPTAGISRNSIRRGTDPTFRLQLRLSGSDVHNALVLVLQGPGTLMGPRESNKNSQFSRTILAPWPCHDACDTSPGVVESVRSR